MFTILWLISIIFTDIDNYFFSKYKTIIEFTYFSI